MNGKMRLDFNNYDPYNLEKNMGGNRTCYQLCIYLILFFVIIFLPGHLQIASADDGFPVISKLGDPWSDNNIQKNILRFQTAYSFDYGDPSAAEQAHLEAINRARLDPLGEAARLGIDLFEGVSDGAISGVPVQPLVYNAKLITAARLHSEDMINQDYFSHYSLDGKDPFKRMKNAGYEYSSAGENIAWMGSTGNIDEVKTVLNLHDNLFLDENYPGRGHRVNILSESFKEVGVGVAFGNYQGYAESYMLTCDFGSPLQYSGAFILGVVYDDMNGDNFYDAGEGISNVSIDVSGAGSTTTATAGGYGIPISPGTYTVTATLSSGSTAQKTVTITTKNQKVDFLGSDFGSIDSIGNLTIGNGPGIQNFGISGSQAVTLMLNLTNTANASPTYEWIFFIMQMGGQQTPLYALTPSGWQAVVSGSTLESLAYNPGGGSNISLGKISMADLGLTTGDTLTYGYAYTTSTATSLVVENMITIQVK